MNPIGALLMLMHLTLGVGSVLVCACVRACTCNMESDEGGTKSAGDTDG